MNLKSLFNKGKKMVDERGGVESLKEDAGELQGIAKGKGSLTDKAKEAAAAIKDPGAPGGEGEKHQPGQGQHEAGRHQGQHNQGQPPKQP
jgi:hypothetical protein